MSIKSLAEKTELRWQQFSKQDDLSDQELAQFKTYASLLVAWNKKFNITAVEEIPAIITHHFQDSLRLNQALDLSGSKTIVDVGSGGGFPGIPLAIKYPHLHIILIEVSRKKLEFLQAVIDALGLSERVSLFDNDWRTFLRTTDFDVDYVCARASLQPEELLRMFKPGSPYKDATLVYWASKNWEPSDKVRPFVHEYVTYKVGHKSRRLALLRR